MTNAPRPNPSPTNPPSRPSRRPDVSPAPKAPTADRRWSVSPTAVVVWMFLQLGCLALTLLHVPLAARYPLATTIGMELLVAGQLAGAALLASLLFRSWGTAVVVVASAWPGLLLAGGLAARPPADTLQAGLLVTLWLATLFFWTSSFSTSTPRQIVSAAATLLAVGAPLLVYLMVEFGRFEDDDLLVRLLGTTPTVLTWAIAGGEELAFGAVLPLGLLLLLGVSVWLIPKRPLVQTASL